jgi:hypothetical protein
MIQYWIDGDRIRFDDGINNGSFTEEYLPMYEPYLAWVAEGNTAEKWEDN